MPDGSHHDHALRYLGDRTAHWLLTREPGDAAEKTGWCGALQTAADLTADDAGVLRIADEIHQAAPDLATRAAVRAYAASTTLVVPGGPGRVLLEAMLEHVGRPCTPP